MDRHDLGGVAGLAALIGKRNTIDGEISAIIGRPALSGHLGEWVASKISDIQLEESAVAKAIDGRFRSGSLAARTVNVKTYGKREGVLDTNSDSSLDFYTVLCGPQATSMTSKGGTRPFSITNAYLFDAAELHADQLARGAKSGAAASVRIELWARAEIYPEPNILFPLDDDQREAVALLALPG